ncbi:hypothetical protein ACWIW6_10795 [Ursidibacter sp. B-7004-1]
MAMPFFYLRYRLKRLYRRVSQLQVQAFPEKPEMGIFSHIVGQYRENPYPALEKSDILFPVAEILGINNEKES